MKLVFGRCWDAPYFGCAKVAKTRGSVSILIEACAGISYRMASTRLNCRASRRSGVA
jgi:hypothetical protein